MGGIGAIYICQSTESSRMSKSLRCKSMRRGIHASLNLEHLNSFVGHRVDEPLSERLRFPMWRRVEIWTIEVVNQKLSVCEETNFLSLKQG